MEDGERIVEHGLEGRFDYLEHTADVYIVAYGSSLLELYENAGLSLFETMTDTTKLAHSVERAVESEGFDLESLLYRWLEDLLTLYYSEGLMCGEIIADEISIKRDCGNRGEGPCYKIKGLCRGEVFDPERHESRVEVKAVTYHMMRITRSGEGEWRAYFVLDI